MPNCPACGLVFTQRTLSKWQGRCGRCAAKERKAAGAAGGRGAAGPAAAAGERGAARPAAAGGRGAAGPAGPAFAAGGRGAAGPAITARAAGQPAAATETTGRAAAAAVLRSLARERKAAELAVAIEREFWTTAGEQKDRHAARDAPAADPPAESRPGDQADDSAPRRQPCADCRKILAVSTLKGWGGVCGRCWHIRQAATSKAALQVSASGALPGTALPDAAQWAEAEAALPKVLFLLCAEYSLPVSPAGITALFLRLSPAGAAWAIKVYAGLSLLETSFDAIATGALFSGHPAVMARVADLAPDLFDEAVELQTKNVFCTLCARGNLPALQWLSRRDKTSKAFQRHRQDGMKLACEYGHLGIAQWLSANYTIGRAAYRSKSHIYALKMASYNGHTDVVNWFTTNFLVKQEALCDAAAAAANEGQYAIAIALMARGRVFADRPRLIAFLSEIGAGRADFGIICRALQADSAEAEAAAPPA